MVLKNEPDILLSLSFNEKPNSSINNLVIKTLDPIRHTRKRTNNVVTTPPIVASHSQKKKIKKRKNVSQLDT